MNGIETFKVAKEQCEIHPYFCKGCEFYDYDEFECMIESIPCNWNIEKIEQALAKMKDGV